MVKPLADGVGFKIAGYPVGFFEDDKKAIKYCKAI